MEKRDLKKQAGFIEAAEALAEAEAGIKKPKTNAERQRAYRERKRVPKNPETGQVKVQEIRRRLDVWVNDYAAFTIQALGILYGTANMGLTIEKVLDDLDNHLRQSDDKDLRERWNKALDKVLGTSDVTG